MKGFTLIETIIYAVLISMIIGFSSFVVYQIINTQEMLKAKIELEEEANFILQKINWALAGASVINQPAANATSTTLSINKANFIQNPLIFDLNNKNIRLSRGGSEAVVLNNSDINIDQLVFEYLSSTSTLKSVKSTITLKSGRYSKTIETINYLRK